MTMDQMLKKGAVGRKLKFVALFSRLWRIAIGGLFAALGVLGMHYLGMMAQRTNAITHWHTGIVALSCVIAFVTADAAFWIIFRAVSVVSVTLGLALLASHGGTSAVLVDILAQL